MKSTESAADGEGFASDFTFNSPLDGTPSKVISASTMREPAAVDNGSLKRLDDHKFAAKGTKNGRLIFSNTPVSKDGMTMTVTRNGVRPEGKRYQSTIVLIQAR